MLSDRKICTVLEYISILSIIVLLINRQQYVVPSMIMACFVLTLFVILLHYQGHKLISEYRTISISKKVILFVLAIMGILALSVIEWAKSDIFDFSSGVSLFRVLYIGYLFLVIIPLLLVSFGFCLLWMYQNRVDISVNQKSSPATVRNSMLIMIIPVLLVLISGYPGLFHSDGAWELWGALEKGPLADWVPITYDFIVSVLVRPFEHPLPVLLFQSYLFLIAQYNAVKILCRRTKDLYCYIYSICVVIFGFSAIINMDVFYKDSLFFPSLFGFMIMLLLTQENPCYRNLVSLVIWGVLASCMRHGAIMIIIGTLLTCALVYLKENKQQAIKTIICLISIMLLWGGLRSCLFAVNKAEKNPQYVTYSVPLYMLASWVSSDRDIDNDTIELMEKVMPINQWKENYQSNIYLADTVSRSWYVSNISVVDELDLHGDIIYANWRYFRNYPLDYLSNFFNINSIVWEMSTPKDGYEWGTHSFVNSELETVQKLIPEFDVEPTLATNIMSPIAQFTKSFPIINMISYRGGLFLYITLSIMAFMLIDKDKKWVICLPSIISALLLMFSIPAQDSRYIMPILVNGLFIMMYYISKPVLRTEKER